MIVCAVCALTCYSKNIMIWVCDCKVLGRILTHFGETDRNLLIGDY